ncbi:MAG: 1-acyl-sn-glycerol-3-phosphate acyltransferase [Verrucomicrobia bacterium]|nr:1-acyl-sn-glycerol-3-phosphate acyltransferase [Verrucomicrobiota bacterium]
MDDWKLKPAQDLGLPLKERASSLRRESGLIETLLHLAWWLMLRCYFTGYHRLEIQGRERLPDRSPFILVANHTSHLDALILATPLRASLRDRIFPIAAGDAFFETPAAALFSAFVLNALPMWRKHCGPHAMQELRHRLLAEGAIYIMFPEGTRSRDGTMRAFKAGLGMLAAETPVPVVPCLIVGAFEALPSHRSIPCPIKITLRIGQPLSFQSVRHERSGWMEIAASVECAVRNLGARPAID